MLMAKNQIRLSCVFGVSPIGVGTRGCSLQAAKSAAVVWLRTFSVGPLPPRNAFGKSGSSSRVFSLYSRRTWTVIRVLYARITPNMARVHQTRNKERGTEKMLVALVCMPTHSRSVDNSYPIA